jgi:spore germination protein KB
MKPWFDGDAPGIARGSMFVLSSYLEIGILLFAANRIQNPGRTLGSMHKVNVATGLLFLLVYEVCLGNFGVAFTERLAFPTVEMVRNINLFQFIEHIESVFLAMFMLINLAKGSLTMYACCVGLQRWFKLPGYKTVMVPLSVIIFYLAQLPQNLPEAVFQFEQFKGVAYPYYGFGAIILLYGLARYRNAKRGKTA